MVNLIARRVATRYRLAKQVPLTVDRVREVQRDALGFARNATLVENEVDHAKVQKAAYAWRNATRPLHGEAMKFVINIADNMPDRKKAERLLATWRRKLAPLFEVVLEVGNFPGWGEHWTRLKAEYVRKVQAAAAALDGVVTYLSTLAKQKMTPMVHQLITERRTVEGFDVILVEYDAENPKHESCFEVLREAFKIYARRARETLPLLLKLKIPFRVDFSVNDTPWGSAGNYGDSQIDVNPFSASENPSRMVKTFAHEMGHHLHRTWLTQPKAAFWSGAIATDWTELDLTDVLEAWQQRPEYWATFESDLRKTDPILYLQLQGAHDHSKTMPKELRDEGWSRENLARYLANGGKRKVRVPAHPITGYATTNPEEAFCEALGNLVAYGPRAVLPLVRQWLDVIFGGHMKLASPVYPRAW